MSYLPKARAENIVIQDLEKETLIYDLKTNKAFCLNETSALVWQLCDGTNSEEFVWLALNELQKDNLLEKADELTNHLAGMKRREMVKRVGMASMIALPIIASVVAPSAAQSQSGCLPDGNSCFMQSDCCSNHCNFPRTCGCLADGEGCFNLTDCCSAFCTSSFTCGCLPEGNSCSLDFDCCNGRCNARNFCQICLPAGSPCAVDDDCCSGNCATFGFMFCT
jgi:Coenzyme PQQ synthesis protein D (PqqD)